MLPPLEVPSWEGAAAARPAIGDLRDPSQRRIVSAFEAWRHGMADDDDAEREFRAAIHAAGLRLISLPNPARPFDFE